MIIKGAKGTESIKAYEEYEKRSQKEVGLMFKAYRKDLKYPTKEECESVYGDKFKIIKTLSSGKPIVRGVLHG